MPEKKKERLLFLDVIRLFSCFCVILVHFNASVSGWNAGVFVHPNSVLTNYLFQGRYYLGSVGVSLFFMISGASLMYTWRKEKLTKFFARRFRSIYPMFWIAWIVATIYDFFMFRGVSGQSLWYLLFSATGMDGYLATMGLIPYDFYKVGEWFLGCIILLYVVFPLVKKGADKLPLLTVLLTAGVYVVCIRLIPSISTIAFFLRIPEILMGILFVKYRMWERKKWLLGIGIVVSIVGWLLRDVIHPLTLCTSLCVGLFALITLVSGFIRGEHVKVVLKKLSDLTYPIFLVHHWLIDRLRIGFPDGAWRRRDVWAMFFIYLILTVVLSLVLTKVTNKVLAALRKPKPPKQVEVPPTEGNAPSTQG